MPAKSKLSTLDRLLGFINQDAPNGCWKWTGAISAGTGYGNFWLNGKTVIAHRLCYLLHRGDIPNGMELDHLCRNRACVNPDHLEAVTRSENQRRGLNCQKVACPQGHSYSEHRATTYVGRHYCRQCARDRSRNRTARQRESNAQGN